ncbi:MAG: betaine-aldehyde dehydrogenase [Halofilum sp. (in: g-proteobacteria)]|nr:betaine-aldehyde dehydrogenase [Halofilum sp. (in: g-proteobacteria)]
MQLDDARLFIDGDFRDAASGETFADVNPADGRTLCHVALAGSEDVDRAVAAAARAQREWARTPAADRGRILRRAAELLRANVDEIARLESLDTGRPIQETPEADVESGAACLEFFGGIAAGINGEYTDLARAFVYTRREPLGVCGGIGAWNYPLQIACWKSAPALATGNAMVFKPAELTPLTALKLAGIYREAGLPAGLFNVVQGFADTGKALTDHPGIAKISLTGEAGTGRKVMAAAAGTLKQVTMELGGKSPLVIFADADLDEAVSAAMMANFYSQGEICTNGTRVFVESSIEAAFLERLKTRTERLRLGDPLDPATQVGPLISTDHMEGVLGYIEAGKSSDARLVCGGARATEGALGDGAYVHPTVFAGCSDDQRIVREEIFGPVMSVLTFDDEDEVVRRANDTEYGLAAGVFTSDLTRAHRVAAELQAGVVWVNNYNVTPIEMPFGGVKASGLGRENGWAAIEFYTQRKSVYVELQGVDSAYE